MTVCGRWREAVIIILLLVVAAVPRTMSLGSFLTADEKNWIGRGYEFVRAFKDWRFNDMLQTSHPGVTTLWLAGAAVAARIVTTGVPFTFEQLRHFVAAAQMPLALANALAVPVIYFLLRRLLAVEAHWPAPGAVAALAALLIALDPWLIGYARVVHVDALLASLLFAAVLSLMLYVLHRYDRRWLLLSAVLSGLALLTKAPAVFIVPFFWLAVASRERCALLAWSHWRDRSRDFVLWGLVAGLVFVLLWPAVLFVPNPEGNALVLKRDLARAVATPHHMAESYRLDAGFYIKTVVTRIAPWTLALAAGAGLWLGWTLLRGGRGAASQGEHGAELPYYLLVAYVTFFMLMMTLGAKKGDRYLLPIAPAVDGLAALALWRGLSGGAAWMRRCGWRENLNVRAVFAAAALILVAASGLTVYRYHPYVLAYSSPLLPDNLSQELGWGEGLEQVGAWLDRTAPRATVAAWYPEELSAYTQARVLHINAHEQPSVRYVVLYRNMFGRAPDHPANDFIDEYYRKAKPVFIARVVGKEFAWVYTREVFERDIGELLPPVRVGQEVEMPVGGAQNVFLLVATYYGRANEGELVVQLRESLGGLLVHEWTRPVSEMTDNQWATFTLPQPLERGNAFVEVFARGTRAGNAPTVRYSRDYNYRASSMLIARDGQLAAADVKQGDLAVRVR